MKYQWKQAARMKIPAQQAGERIARIEAKSAGLVTATAVVQDARKASSPLHPAFEWDDLKAAEEYRLEQARHLLHSLQVVAVKGQTEEPHSFRAYVQVTIDAERGYTNMYRALSDDGLRLQVLTRALHELDTWRERYHELEELTAIFDATENVREAVGVA